MGATLIQVEKSTADSLKNLKLYDRETYDLVIKRLISLAKDELNVEDIESIERGLKDIKEGRLYTSDEVREKLGIKGN